jgi:hypothetical protein
MCRLLLVLNESAASSRMDDGQIKHIDRELAGGDSSILYKNNTS